MSRWVREASFSRTRTLVSPRAAAHTHTHAPPAPHEAVRVRTGARPLGHVCPQPCRSGRTRDSGLTRSPRALAARAAARAGARGWGLRWPPEGHGAEAQAFTCAGQGPRGGEGQERRQQPHPVQEQRRFQAGGRAQRRPPGMPRAGGTGFYSGAATGGSPYSGARVPAPPPGGASPPASCP